MRRLIAATVLLATLAGGIALAAPGGHRRHAGCGAIRVAAGPPDQRVLASVGVLRRPRTPADAPSTAARRHPALGNGFHFADARAVASAHGAGWIVPVDDVRPRVCAPGHARPGVVVLGNRLTGQGASVAEIVAGRAVETDSCAGPTHDLLGVDAILPDGATDPYLALHDGHTVLGDVRDNMVSFLVTKDRGRAGVPAALGFTDGHGVQRRGPLGGGSFALQHCAPPPRFAISTPAQGPGRIEAVAPRGASRGSIPLAAEVALHSGSRCVTVGLRTPAGLGRHVSTGCYGLPLGDRPFGATALRMQRLGHRALLVGVADPAEVRLVEVVTAGRTFAVRPSRSGAFFVAYADGQPAGRTWRLRAVLRRAGGRTTPDVSVVLGPTRPGVAPPGAARTISPALQAAFAVFRRPRTAADALPRRRGGEVFHYGDVNPLLSRFLGRRLGSRYWLVPGRRDLCVVEHNGNGGGSSGCGRVATNVDPATPMGGYGTRVPSYVVLPDVIRTVTVEHARGGRTDFGVAGNLFALRRSRAIRTAYWTLPDGRRITMPGFRHATDPPQPAPSGFRAADSAIRATRTTPACRPPAVTTAAQIDDPVPAGLTAILPIFAHPAPAAERSAALSALGPGLGAGEVLRRSVHRIVLPGVATLTVMVRRSAVGPPVTDPAACAVAREAHLARDAPGLSAAQRALAVRLIEDRARIADLLVISARPGGAATAIPLDAVEGRPPRGRMPRGLLLSTSIGDGHRLFIGVTDRATATLAPAVLRDGFWAIRLRAHGGRAVLRLRARDGHRLGAVVLRP